MQNFNYAAQTKNDNCEAVREITANISPTVTRGGCLVNGKSEQEFSMQAGDVVMLQLTFEPGVFDLCVLSNKTPRVDENSLWYPVGTVDGKAFFEIINYSKNVK